MKGKEGTRVNIRTMEMPGVSILSGISNNTSFDLILADPSPNRKIGQAHRFGIGVEYPIIFQVGEVFSADIPWTGQF